MTPIDTGPLAVSEILDALPATRLIDYHHRFGIYLPIEKSRPQLVLSLLGSTRFPTQPRELLETLSAPELRQLCRERGLAGVGIDTAALADMLLGEPTKPDEPLFQRLPAEVQEEFAARRREVAERDASHRETQRRERGKILAGVVLVSLIFTMALHYPFWHKLLLAAGAGGGAWMIGHFELARTRACCVMLSQAAILTVAFGLPTLSGMGDAFLLVFFFSYWLLEAVMGVLLGMREEGCFDS